MESLLLASLTIPVIITFLRLAMIWAGVLAPVVRTENIFKKDIWVPHIQQILDNCTLPVVGAPCIISQEMEVFQRIAFPKIKSQCSNNSRQCWVKQSGDPNIPQDVWEYLRFNPLPF